MTSVFLIFLQNKMPKIYEKQRSTRQILTHCLPIYKGVRQPQIPESLTTGTYSYSTVSHSMWPLSSLHQIPRLFQAFLTKALIFIKPPEIYRLMSEYCGTIGSPSCTCQLKSTQAMFIL